MADGKILKIIDDMSDYVDSHNAGPLSRDKIKISKDELFNYIDRLRQTLPNEFEEASKITKAKNEILKAAMNKASQIEEDAQNQLQELIKEDEVVIAADKEAQNIVDNAEKEADDIIKEAEGMAAQIKIGALSYAEEMLATVEKMVSHNLKVTIENSNSVIDTLKNTLEIIQNNRDELNAQILEAREVNGYGPDEDESQEKKKILWKMLLMETLRKRTLQIKIQAKPLKKTMNLMKKMMMNSSISPRNSHLRKEINKTF